MAEVELGAILHYEWNGVLLKGKVIQKTKANGKTIYHVI